MFICFLYFVVSLVSGDFYPYKENFGGLSIQDFFFVREGPPEFPILKSVKCHEFEKTHSSPFVVLLLYKTSGALIGMGGIINSKTILTVEGAIRFAIHKPTEILVLAGYRSAWWGPNSQVRTVQQTYSNDYDLVLLELDYDLKFNNKIQPLKLGNVSDALTDTYQSNLVVFGISVPKNFHSGDKIPKNLQYFGIKRTVSEKKYCENEYSLVGPKFEESVHQCLHENGSFCSECVGSPVLGSPQDSTETKFMGIVLKSNCIFRSHKVLILKIAKFTDWIRANSYYGSIAVDVDQR